MNQAYKPVTIGITGGSASGKTTFAKALDRELLPISSVTLNQDSYFKDWSRYPDETPTANHPNAVCWESLIEHIKRLAAGQPITTPVPGTRAAARKDTPDTIQPGHVIIIEGHLILWNEAIRNLMDIKLFIDIDPHERVLRRLLRDVGQRNSNLERAVEWYRKDVIPNFPVYTESCKQYADLVIPFQNKNSPALQMIAAGVREVVALRQNLTGKTNTPLS